MVKENKKRGATQKQKGKEGRNKTERKKERKKDLEKQTMVEQIQKFST